MYFFYNCCISHWFIWAPGVISHLKKQSVPIICFICNRLLQNYPQQHNSWADWYYFSVFNGPYPLLSYGRDNCHSAELWNMGELNHWGKDNNFWFSLVHAIIQLPVSHISSNFSSPQNTHFKIIWTATLYIWHFISNCRLSVTCFSSNWACFAILNSCNLQFKAVENYVSVKTEITN